MTQIDNFHRAWVAAFFFYIYFFQVVVSPIPFLIHFLFAILLIKFAIEKAFSRVSFTEFRLILLFFILNFIAGILITDYLTEFFQKYIVVASYVILLIMIFRLAQNLTDIVFLFKVFFATSFCFCCALALFGEYNDVTKRLAINIEGNSNFAAFMIYLCSISFLFLREYYKKGYLQTILFMFLLIPLLIDTGSRKNLAVFFIVQVSYAYLIFNSKKRRGLVFFIGLTCLLLLFFSFDGEYIIGESVMRERLEGSAHDSDDIRKLMIFKAVELFLEYPVLGVGVWNFANLTSFGTYSHSTYAEIIASSGVLGASIWLIILIRGIVHSKKILSIESSRMIYIKLIALIFLGSLIYGLGTVLIYEPYFYMLLGLNAGVAMNINKKKEIWPFG